MKRCFAIAAAVPLLSFAAAAQDGPFASQVKVMSLRGGVMGKTVKGAPYSATEVTENNQTLADGTRIHNEVQTQVWRDSEGRVRRETGNEVMIYDPVAGVSYSLNTKNQTARKLPLGSYLFTSIPDNSKTAVQYFRFSTSDNSPQAQKLALEAQLKAAQTEYGATKKVEQDAVEAKRSLELSTLETRVAGPNIGFATARTGNPKGVVQSLGKRTIEGVTADGTSETSTIEAGAIGNDRAIQSVSERWYSTDLQTLMMSRHTDPRTGEETFKLINVSRVEPPSYLFQVPAGYQMIQ